MVLIFCPLFYLLIEGGWVHCRWKQKSSHIYLLLLFSMQITTEVLCSMVHTYSTFYFWFIFMSASYYFGCNLFLASVFCILFYQIFKICLYYILYLTVPIPEILGKLILLFDACAESCMLCSLRFFFWGPWNPLRLGLKYLEIYVNLCQAFTEISVNLRFF
jgi:hypothetical protein